MALLFLPALCGKIGLGASLLPEGTDKLPYHKVPKGKKTFENCQLRCKWSHDRGFDRSWGKQHQLHQQPSGTRRQRAFAICGQSNAAGYGRRSDLEPSVKKRIAAVADRVTVAEAWCTKDHGYKGPCGPHAVRTGNQPLAPTPT